MKQNYNTKNPTLTSAHTLTGTNTPAPAETAASTPQKPTRIHKLTTKMKRSKMGMGTLEVVIIMAALLTLALFFSGQIKDFAGTVAEQAFRQTDVLSELGKSVE